MDTQRIEQLAGRVRRIGGHAMVVNDTGRAVRRTHDPTARYEERMGTPEPEFLERIRSGAEFPPLRELNLTVGWRPVQDIGGLAMVAVSTWPQEAADVAGGDGPAPSLLEIAGRLLGTWESRGGRALTALLLHGPSGLGARAGWIRPEGAADALERAAAGEPLRSWWKVPQERYAQLEETYQPDLGAFQAWREGVAREARAQVDGVNVHNRTRETWRRQTRPQIATGADVDLLAYVADGAAVRTKASVGRLATIGPGTTIESRVVIAEAQIGANCRIGEDTAIDECVEIGNRVEIGAGVQVGGGVTIGTRARIGERSEVHVGAEIGGSVVLCEETAVGSAARIGNDAFVHAHGRIGAGASLGKGTVVGRKASVAPGIGIGPDRLVPDGVAIADATDAELLTMPVVRDYAA